MAIINPRFLLPINLANTSNLIGLFGILSIGQAFVIITGGIELSVGSVIALLGTLFVDFIAVRGMDMAAGLRADHRARRHHRPGAWLADHAAETAALRGDAVRPA